MSRVRQKQAVRRSPQQQSRPFQGLGLLLLGMVIGSLATLLWQGTRSADDGIGAGIRNMIETAQIERQTESPPSAKQVLPEQSEEAEVTDYDFYTKLSNTASSAVNEAADVASSDQGRINAVSPEPNDSITQPELDETSLVEQELDDPPEQTTEMEKLISNEGVEEGIVENGELARQTEGGQILSESDDEQRFAAESAVAPVNVIEQGHSLLDSTSGSSAYMLEVGSFQSLDGARKLHFQLSDWGLAAAIQRVSKPGRGDVYRVLLGPYLNYKDMDEVDEALLARGVRSFRLKVSRGG